jgi:hypothetical protein
MVLGSMNCQPNTNKISPSKQQEKKIHDDGGNNDKHDDDVDDDDSSSLLDWDDDDFELDLDVIEAPKQSVVSVDRSGNDDEDDDDDWLKPSEKINDEPKTTRTGDDVYLTEQFQRLNTASSRKKHRCVECTRPLENQSGKVMFCESCREKNCQPSMLNTKKVRFGQITIHKVDPLPSQFEEPIIDALDSINIKINPPEIECESTS